MVDTALVRAPVAEGAEHRPNGSDCVGFAAVIDYPGYSAHC